MPAFKAAGAELNTVVSAGGVSALHFGRNMGSERLLPIAILFSNDAIDTSGCNTS